MKNAYYFSHDYTAREDEKIKNLIYKHDWYGYGLYWAIIEQLYANEGYLEPNYKRIAHDLRTSEETIKSIIEEFNLFDFAYDKFTSCSVLRRLKKQKTISQKRRDVANTRWKKGNAIALQTKCKSNAIKESKVNENKIKENININTSNEVLVAEPQVSVKNFGNESVNKMLAALIGKIKVEDFRESKREQRQWGMNLYRLFERLGKDEFLRRLDSILADSFKSKNVHSLKYLYKEIKAFIEPQNLTVKL